MANRVDDGGGVNHTGNHPGVGRSAGSMERLFREAGTFGTAYKDAVGKNVKVGIDSYSLKGLNGKMGVEDSAAGIDSKEGLNERYGNRRREEEGRQKVGMVQNWALGMEVEHEGIHSQYHMGMKMKGGCCNCPCDLHL